MSRRKVDPVDVEVAAGHTLSCAWTRVDYDCVRFGCDARHDDACMHPDHPPLDDNADD